MKTTGSFLDLRLLLRQETDQLQAVEEMDSVVEEVVHDEIPDELEPTEEQPFFRKFLGRWSKFCPHGI